MIHTRTILLWLGEAGGGSNFPQGNLPYKALTAAFKKSSPFHKLFPVGIDPVSCLDGTLPLVVAADVRKGRKNVAVLVKSFDPSSCGLQSKPKRFKWNCEVCSGENDWRLSLPPACGHCCLEMLPQRVCTKKALATQYYLDYPSLLSDDHSDAGGIEDMYDRLGEHDDDTPFNLADDGKVARQKELTFEGHMVSQHRATKEANQIFFSGY